MTQELLWRPEPRFVRSFDGTAVAFRRVGAAGAEPVLVVNPVGATLALWRLALVDLAREHPVVAWDHRGLHDSEPPVSGRLDPGAQAQDAVAVLDSLETPRALVVAWSNGARIALELAATHPERVGALAVVCGGYGHSPARLLRHLELAAAFPPAAGVVKYFAPVLQRPLQVFVNRPEIVGFVRQSGLIAATADTDSLVGLLRDLARCDLGRLLASYEAVAGAAAPELLASVAADTLLVAGERDPFTARAVTEEMAAAIPRARLVVYEDSTHYLPIEYPARLSQDLREFFGRYGSEDADGRV